MSDRINCLIRISNEDLFKQFVHACIDDLICLRPITYNNFNTNIEWTKSDYSQAVKLIQDIISKYCHQTIDSIDELDQLDDARKQLLIKYINLRKSEILNAFLTTKYSESENLVTDFDWKLKLVMGSAKYTNFTEPLVQLDLHTLNSGLGRDIVTMEMDSNELKKLIVVLEEAITE